MDGFLFVLLSLRVVPCVWEKRTGWWLFCGQDGWFSLCVVVIEGGALSVGEEDRMDGFLFVLLSLRVVPCLWEQRTGRWLFCGQDGWFSLCVVIIEGGALSVGAKRRRGPWVN
ncbi:hypothetical protein AVEN_181831-1 [Araneus ventricosus]|uniref:Uncharacterized protein n=1 Tax=Araneus ventricosus TaxID=182803 RepID=A0A4Y2EZZ2_ARAVE|nr:hypothetical protein AVEN_181831-1 [Araneus ventricosus]